MKGLIFNILSELSERAGCQDDAWEVALAGAALGDDDYAAENEAADDPEAALSAEEEEALEDEAEDALDAETFEMPYLEGEWGDSFRFLLRSASPFEERDWAHLPGTPVSFGKPERSPSQPPSDRSSFLPEADATDPYVLLMLSLAPKR